MNATGDTDSGSVTVTCQASLRELRGVALWMYLHDRAAHMAILLVITGAVLIFFLFNRIVAHGNFIEHPSWIAGRGLASALWLLVFFSYRVWLLVTLPERAWRRLQKAGPTTLTVSDAGLSWYNSAQRNQSGWERYLGYALIPEGLLLISSVPFIVPRSTVNPVDLERVVAIAKRHLHAITQFNSQKPRAPAAPATS